MNIRIRHAKGLTLIELMITVAVLGVIAAIAVPAYTGYIQTSRQTEGWNNLRALEVAEEEYYLENNAYFIGANASALATASGGLWSRTEAAAVANFEYTAATVGSGYTLTATGQNKVPASVVLTITK